MPYKNIKELLVDATKLPAAVEAMLPAGAPKLSTMLVDAASKIPTVPDFPMEIPDLPAPPTLPTGPTGLPWAPPGRVVPRPVPPYYTMATVTPIPGSAVTPLVQAYTQPIEGVVGQVTSRRGM